MRIETDTKLDFDDVLIRPKRSEIGSRADVNLIREFVMRNAQRDGKPCKIKGVPIIAANMDTVGTFAMAGALCENKLFTCLHKFYSESRLEEYFSQIFHTAQLKVFEQCEAMHYSFYTTGIADYEIEKLKRVSEKVFIPKICIDVANGYTKYFVDKVRQVRELFPYSIIMAGNVCTGNMTQELLLNGADIVKIGIGPGKVCETRKVTGVGYPQLSAIMECADTAHGVGGHICADGGCATSGDIAKAFGAGADFVMLGTMLAGHDECEGEWVYEPKYEWHEGTTDYPTPGLCQNGVNRKALKVYGMSSREAMEKYYGGVAAHRAPEGCCIEIPYKGPVANTINNILGGLRSSCTYIGTDDIKHFSKCTTFIKKV